MPMYWTFNCFFRLHIYTVYHIVFIVFSVLNWLSNLEFRVPKKEDQVARKKTFFFSLRPSLDDCLITGAILISDDHFFFLKSSSNIRHQQTRQYLKCVFFHEKMLIKMFIKSKISFITVSIFHLFPNMQSFFGDLSSSCAFLFPENGSELSKDRIASKKDKFETRLNFLLRR